MPVEDTPVHESTKKADRRAGCYNRPPFATGYWGCIYGARQWIPHTASTKCRQILDLPECAGCNVEKDHEYINKMKELSK